MVAALTEESQEFIEASPLVARTRCNKGLVRRKTLKLGEGLSKKDENERK